MSNTMKKTMERITKNAMEQEANRLIRMARLLSVDTLQLASKKLGIDTSELKNAGQWKMSTIAKLKAAIRRDVSSVIERAMIDHGSSNWDEIPEEYKQEVREVVKDYEKILQP